MCFDRNPRGLLRWFVVSIGIAAILAFVLREPIVDAYREQRFSRLFNEMKLAYQEGRNDDGDRARTALLESGPDAMRWLGENLEVTEDLPDRLRRSAQTVLPSNMQAVIGAPVHWRQLDGWTIGLLESFGPPAAKYFTNYLDESRFRIETRHRAYMALANIGNASPEILALLSRQMSSTNLSDQIFASGAYARLEPDSVDVVANRLAAILLTNSMANSNDRLWAANALGSIGGAATNAISALEQALEDPEPHVRSAVERALWGIQKRSKHLR